MDEMDEMDEMDAGPSECDGDGFGRDKGWGAKGGIILRGGTVLFI